MFISKLQLFGTSIQDRFFIQFNVTLGWREHINTLTFKRLYLTYRRLRMSLVNCNCISYVIFVQSLCKFDLFFDKDTYTSITN